MRSSTTQTGPWLTGLAVLAILVPAKGSLAASAATASTATAPKPTTADGTAASGKSGYHFIKEIAIPGEGGWDYLAVDRDARRLYVTRSTRVVVVDIDAGKVVGEIPDLQGIHGVAIAGALGRGFISNGKSSTVTIFDLKTLAKLGDVKVTGENPDAILFDPATSRVFAFNGHSGDATVIEAATGKVAGTLALGGKPEFATADGKGLVFVNIEDKSEIVEIDAKSMTIKARWPLTPCEEPSGMAIDRVGRRLLSGCSNRVAVVVNADSGKVVTTVPIGEGVDANAFDSGSHLGFSSNGEGTLTVISEASPDAWTVLDTVKTRRGARTMALDEASHQVFLATAQFGPTPSATAEHPHPRPPMVADTFVILIYGR